MKIINVLGSFLVMSFLVINVTSTTYDVDIADFSFSPSTLTIKVGDTVRWTNRDEVAHTTTEEEGEWDSGNMGFEETFSYTFNSQGSFNYFCAIHPSMIGQIVVEAANSGKSGDVDGDGQVNLIDLALLGQAWQSSEGDSNYNADADLNSDGMISLLDLALLGQNWDS